MIIEEENVNNFYKEICVLPAEKIEQAISDKKNNKLANFIYNSETGIVYYPIPVDLKSYQLFNKFGNEGVKPNFVYIFNEVGNQYIELVEYMKQAPIIKYRNIATVYGLLGAKKVKIEQINCDYSNNETSASAGGKVAAKTIDSSNAKLEADIDIKSMSSIIESIKSRFYLEQEFSGEKNLEKAIEYAKSRNLINDTTLRDLFDIDHIITKKIVLEVDMFQEIKKVVEASATLNIETSLLQKMFEGSAGFYTDIVKKKEENHSLHYKMHVEF